MIIHDDPWWSDILTNSLIVSIPVWELCPTFTVLSRKPMTPPPPTPPTPPHQPHSRSSGGKMQVSKPCVSPFARLVTYQTIPGFSTTGPGNNGELSMEAAALCVQSPLDTSPPFKKKQPSIWLYISAAHVLIAAIFFPLSVNKRDLRRPLAGMRSH